MRHSEMIVKNCVHHFFSGQHHVVQECQQAETQRCVKCIRGLTYMDADSKVYGSIIKWDEVSQQHEGVYQCRVQNKLASAFATYFLFKSGVYPPSNLKAKTVKDGILLTWDKSLDADVDNYVLYYGLLETFPEYYMTEIILGSKVNVTMIGLESFKMYSFYLIAISKSTEVSEVSQTVSAISPENGNMPLTC
ncbi:hypothetical protein HELRODRAFT_158384 [Helobdella robusta]|uniref:Fibronectin type-III domain-containing protein n=1 Tax=Helobdella robusta TaxID=6412 RepID=T1EMQ8_HELRO|nr:hypothetical protein HELRODRAFT_158384 [Helobdella robusta]ESO11998.1 hypothetical protein HELRODRAFT_158384 [Helobdella robusta]